VLKNLKIFAGSEKCHRITYYFIDYCIGIKSSFSFLYNWQIYQSLCC